MSTFGKSKNKLVTYFTLCYLINFLLCINFALNTHPSGWKGNLFVAILTLTYPLIYMAPTVAIGWLFQKLANRSRRLFFAYAVVLVLANAFLSMVLITDIRLFDLYGFHINAFVINLIVTPGGIASLGGSIQTYIVTGVFVLLIIVLHLLLFLGSFRFNVNLFKSKSALKVAMLVFFTLTLSERIAYGVSDGIQYAPILKAATKFPLYNQVTFRGLLGELGVELVKQKKINLKLSDSALRYPLHPLSKLQPKKNYNIIWLVSESMRWDMLTPEIMPNTYAASKTGWRFENHYSGGNGTRQGLFSLFYGIYGSYWDAFLLESKSPVLLDLLQERDYQLDMFTSADFTYPEFNQTLFANIPANRLHSLGMTLSPWQRDEENTRQIIEMMKNREKDKPFMNFMFFESTHARYDFPEESAIRSPYLQDLNYALMTRKSLAPRIDELKNRYINASAFIDTQILRIFDALSEEGLWEDTIVIVTGDHGEEFMEKGFWGHNSGFSEEQIRTPMVIWIPGKESNVIHEMTSHMDIIPTILPLLGVQNPIEDYSSGLDLTKPLERSYIVVSDWAGIAYLDDQYKFTLPFNSSLNSANELFDKNDEPSNDIISFIGSYKSALDDALINASRFRQD